MVGDDNVAAYLKKKKIISRSRWLWDIRMKLPRKQLCKCFHLEYDMMAETIRGSWIQWYDQMHKFKGGKGTPLESYG